MATIARLQNGNKLWTVPEKDLTFQKCSGCEQVYYCNRVRSELLHHPKIYYHTAGPRLNVEPDMPSSSLEAPPQIRMRDICYLEIQNRD